MKAISSLLKSHLTNLGADSLPQAAIEQLTAIANDAAGKAIAKAEAAAEAAIKRKITPAVIGKAVVAALSLPPGGEVKDLGPDLIPRSFPNDENSEAVPSK